MIVTNVDGLRDPFILLENGVYYMYGTGVVGTDWDNTVWDCYVNDSGSLCGPWKRTENLVYERPAKALKQFWSPEVHKYKDKFYMFATYFSAETNRRGTTVLRADSPTGPFVEISDGPVTPKEWDAIDGTLYVDREGQPWLVFVHEWVCTDDRIGRMDVAKLSDDLSRVISEPVEIFRADSPAWTDCFVTDGPFLYTFDDGKILMLWSNLEKDGYCVGIAHSDKVDGCWKQEDAPFYKRGVADQYDGGHGMLFRDIDGQQYMAIHSPNESTEECAERAVLIPVREEAGSLRIG